MILRISLLSVAMLLASLGASVGEDSVSDFAWLAGHWRGEGLGGQCEEIWSAPMAGTMVGSFRLIKDGKVSFYELMVISKDEEGFSLKVKHFTPDFVSWEDKEDSVRFALEEVGPNKANFSGLTMERKGDELEVKLRMKHKDGSITWEPFHFRRHEPGAPPSEEN